MGELQVIYLPLSALTPDEKNAKQHPADQVEQIKESIKTFKMCDPIGIAGDENLIIEGHGRYLALQELGVKEAPCIRLDHLDTDEKRKAYALIHNKTTMNSGFDIELLDMNLAEIETIDMGLYGFETITDEKQEAAQEDDYDVEPPAEPKAKYGDLYQLGRHRLMCGDSTKTNDVECLMGGHKAELTFTDPPYELDTQGGGILKSANSMKQIRQNGVDKFEPLELQIFSDTNIYCHNKPLIKKYIELAEVNNLPYDLCFYKKQNTAPNYGGHLMTDCEYIAVIGKQAPNKGLPKETYSKCFIGKKDKGNELSYSKPIELCAKYIRLYGKQNILDLFGGSGSTLIACEQLGKTCFMMELDPKYVDVIINRWETLTGEKAVKIN